MPAHLFIGQPDLRERDSNVLRCLGVDERDLRIGPLLTLHLSLDPCLLLITGFRLGLAELAYHWPTGKLVNPFIGCLISEIIDPIGQRIDTSANQIHLPYEGISIYLYYLIVWL